MKESGMKVYDPNEDDEGAQLDETEPLSYLS